MASGDDFDCYLRLNNNYTTVRCSTEHPYCSIRKLVRLLETTEPELQLERKTMLVRDFLTACPCAFWMHDIPQINRFIELTLPSPPLLANFRREIDQILCHYCVPPMLVRTSEIFDCKRDLTEHFNFLSFLLTENLRDSALRILYHLLEDRPLPGKCCVPLKARREAAGLSHLAETVAGLLQVVDEEFYSSVLDFAALLAEKVEGACYVMVENEAVNTVMMRLEPNWSSRNRNFPPDDFVHQDLILNCDVALKVLWLLLSSLKASSTKFLQKIKPPDQQNMWSFRYAFRILIAKKHSEVERNQCLAIILLCMQYLPNFSFSQSGLAQDIATMSTGQKYFVDNFQLQLTASDADYQFMKMLLLGLSFSIYDNSAIIIYHENNVVKWLLNFLTPELVVAWIKEQRKKLTIMTLSVLQQLTGHLKQDFVKNKADSRLLAALEYHFCNSCDSEIIAAFLRCLHLTEISDTTAEPLISDLCLHFSMKCQLTSKDQECLSYCLSILTNLYAHQSKSNETIINAAISYMKRYLRSRNDDLACDHRTLICLLDLLWNGLLTNEDNLKYFINSGNVYTLLDLVQNGIFPIQLVALGLLVDLCEEGSCIPHLLTWRSQGKTLTSLLMSVFRQENERLGVKVDERGIIDDVEQPLMGEQQHLETRNTEKDPNSSPATVDLIGSCRPKVYAILQLLKHRHRETVELVNEQYKLQNQPLTHEDQITKLLAENYLQFKLGEAWCEINKDLQTLGLHPMAIDGQIIETLIRKHYHWSMQVKEIQEEVLKRKNKEDMIDEYALYKMLKESRLYSALCALKELHYVARITEHLIRHSEKLVQNKQVEDSLPYVKDKLHFYRTFMYNIGVTNVFGLMVNVEDGMETENCDDENLEPQCVQTVACATVSTATLPPEEVCSDTCLR